MIDVIFPLSSCSGVASIVLSVDLKVNVEVLDVLFSTFNFCCSIVNNVTASSCVLIGDICKLLTNSLFTLLAKSLSNFVSISVFNVSIFCVFVVISCVFLFIFCVFVVMFSSAVSTLLSKSVILPVFSSMFSVLVLTLVFVCCSSVSSSSNLVFICCNSPSVIVSSSLTFSCNSCNLVSNSVIS